MKKITLFSFLFFAFGFFSGNAQVQVGFDEETAATVPIQSCYGYSYTQQIYYQSELNSSGTITAISFYVDELASVNDASSDWTIYMGNTSKTEFTNDTDWEDIGNLLQVYSGTVTYPEAGNWMTITFDTPFSYDNEENLLLAVDENQDGFDCSNYWGASATNDDRSIVYRSDSTNPDPLSPPTASSTYSYIANAIFTGITQSCLVPTALEVSNVSTTYADISWTENNTAEDWTVEYGEYGFELGTGTTFDINQTTATLEGLEAGTTYEVYVMADCGDSQSSYSQSLVFSTDCVAITSFPWTEDFESASTPELPVCWTYLNNNDDSDYFETYSGYGVDDSQSVGLYTDFNYGANDDYLILPQITLTGNERLKFNVRARSSNEPNDYEVVLSTTGTDAEDFTTVLQPLTTVSTTTQTQINPIYLDDYSGDVYIAIHVPVDGLDGYYIYFDDFIIEEIPSCLEPQDLAVSNITNYTADLSWTENGDASTWNIEYGETGFENGTGTEVTVTENPYTLTGLTPNTVYEYYVQASCGDGDESTWIGPFEFATTCLAVTSFPWTEDFEGAVTPELPSCWSFINNNDDADYFKTYDEYGVEESTAVGLYTDYNSGENDDYLVLPQFTLTGNERLKFNVRARSSYEPNDYEVVLSTTGTNAEDFTTVLQPLTTVSTTTQTEINPIYLDDYSGDVYIAIHVPADGLDGYYIYFDDFIVEEIPSCPTPSGLVISNITASSADISWEENGDATEWTIEYGEAGFTLGEGTSITVTSMPYTLSDLSSTTEYEVYISSNCSYDEVSEWSTLAYFETPCTALDLPYTNDFSDFPGSCWSEGNNSSITEGPNGENGAWLSDDYLNDSDSGIDAARVNLWNTGDSDWLVTPEFMIPTDVDYGVAYQVGVTTYSGSDAISMGSDDEVQFLISSDGGITWTSLETYNVDNTPSNEGEERLYDLSTYAGETVKFAYWATEGTVDDDEDYNFYVTNFEVDTYQALGNASFEQLGFKYYPNPVNNNVLNLSAQENIESVVVYNLVGQQVLTLEPNATSYQVNMTALTQGTYFVTLSIGGSTETIKILKK